MEIKELMSKYQELDGQIVNIQGWVRNKRNGKNVSFVMINDGTCFNTIQVVYKNLDNQAAVEKINIAAALDITGKVVLTNNEKQPFEIQATNIIILDPSKEDYQLQPKKHSYEFLREIAHLRPRTNTFNAVFRIRSLLSYAIHQFFNENGFVMLHAPLITASDAEGAGEMFQVTTLNLDNLEKEAGNVNYHNDFFNKKVNLTVSGQLVAEAYALAFRKVYTFGPTFRAENSNTTRHAAEFWMVEPEIAFANLNDVIKLAQDMLVSVINYVLANGYEELQFLDSISEIDVIDRLEKLVNSEFKQITYKEAINLLQEAVNNGHQFENEVSFGIDLATEHERYLTDVIFKAPVFVTNYPRDIKAFYMKENDDADKTVAATDLLVPGIGELIGGSQREVRYDVLINKMDEFKLNKAEYEWYLQLREYGSVDHAGFGLGFERLIMYVTGMENIRDVIPFPRTSKNCQY